MAPPYLDSPLTIDSGDSTREQINESIPSHGTDLYHRLAEERDVVRTVDISIALHKQLYPLVVTGWIVEKELSAQLIGYRENIVRSPRSQHSLTVAFIFLSDREVFGDCPAERLSETVADKLREEDVGYLIGVRPHRDGGDPITDSLKATGNNSPKLFRHRAGWKAERKEYLTDNTWGKPGSICHFLLPCGENTATQRICSSVS
tara:strand:+ start:597 stop:1208 length:612 start_codon:yes stop_codon:yes gene_type:complete